MKNSKKIIIIALVLVFCIIISICLLLGLNNNTYTIEFDTSGGTFIEKVLVKKGTTITPPEVPLKKGFTFEGWYLGDKKFDFNDKIDKNLVLKASWKNDGTTKIYKVSFDSNGGSKVDMIEISEGEIITEPLTPTKKGYSFKGWYFNDELFDFTFSINSDMTLKAKWEQKEGNDIDSSRGNSVSSKNEYEFESTKEINNLSNDEIKNILNNLKGTWYCKEDVDNYVQIHAYDTYINDKKAFEIKADNIDLHSPAIFSERGHGSGMYMFYPIHSDMLKKFLKELNVSSVYSDSLVIGNKYHFSRNKTKLDLSQYDKYLGVWYKLSGEGEYEVSITKEVDGSGNTYFRIGRYAAETIENRKILDKTTVFDKYTSWSGKHLKIGNGLYTNNKNELPVSLQSFEIKLSNNNNLKPGDVVQATIIPTPKNATDLTGSWKIYDESIATINNNGKITIKNYGQTLIEFISNDGGRRETTTLHALEVFASKINLSETNIVLKQGESKTITYSLLPENVSYKDVEMYVTNSKVARSTLEKNSITITALEQGTTTFTIKSLRSKVSADINITVVPEPVTAVSLDCTNIELYRDDEKQLKASITPSTASNKSINWTSSNNSIVTVKNGKIKGIKKGKATITATTVDGNFSSTCEVTVLLKPLEVKANLSYEFLVGNNGSYQGIVGTAYVNGGSGENLYNMKLYLNNELISEVENSLSNKIISKNKSGFYRFEVTVIDSDGNTASNFEEIEFN